MTFASNLNILEVEPNGDRGADARAGSNFDPLA